MITLPAYIVRTRTEYVVRTAGGSTYAYGQNVAEAQRMAEKFDGGRVVLRTWGDTSSCAFFELLSEEEV